LKDGQSFLRRLERLLHLQELKMTLERRDRPPRAASQEQLERWGDRVLDATSLDEVFRP
jgi:hypothetical protein